MPYYPPVNGITLVPYQYINIVQQQNSGTGPTETATTTGQVARTLNTILHDDTGVVTLNSNTFVLPAGTYNFKAFGAVDGATSSFAMQLVNSTDSITYQGPPVSGPATLSQVVIVHGSFTIAASKSFALFTYVASAASTSWGKTMTSGKPEMYVGIELWKTK